jgi:hypothetical protein
MSQLENVKTHLELRPELHKMVVADLIGLAGGKMNRNCGCGHDWRIF